MKLCQSRLVATTFFFLNVLLTLRVSFLVSFRFFSQWTIETRNNAKRKGHLSNLTCLDVIRQHKTVGKIWNVIRSFESWVLSRGAPRRCSLAGEIVREWPENRQIPFHLLPLPTSSSYQKLSTITWMSSSCHVHPCPSKSIGLQVHFAHFNIIETSEISNFPSFRLLDLVWSVL